MLIDPLGLIVDDCERGVFRVNRQVFTDSDVLALERECIFDRCWLYAGHESELPNPGDFRTRRVGGRPLILVRGADRQIRALLNSCRHRGTMVCREPAGNANSFRCFYHAWTYDNRGHLIGVPGEDAYSEAFSRAEFRLMEAPRVDHYRGFYFVNFDPGAEPLADYLAGARAHFDLLDEAALEGLEIVGGSQQYSMRANWKLMMENGFDGYHPSTVHHRYFADFLPRFGVKPPTEVWGGRGAGSPGHEPRPLGNGHAAVLYPLSSARLDVMGAAAEAELKARREALEASLGAERAAVVADGAGLMLVFPNLAIIDGIRTIRTAYPLAPDMVEITAWSIQSKADSPELRAKQLASFQAFQGPGGFATPDDIEALESCQRGFATNREVQWTDVSRGMKRAHPWISDELQIRVFWRKWYDLMTGQRREDYGDRNDAGAPASREERSG
jgi:p-cumate 2,3-dioxygenase subunit alpha